MVRILTKIEDRNKNLKISSERNYPVVKSNVLIQKTRYSLSLAEQKLILHLIQKIRIDDEEFQKYDLSIKEYCLLCGIDSDNGKNYKNIKSSLKSLADKSFWVPDDTGKEILCRWIAKAEIFKSSGVIKIQLDNDLRPYLLKLQGFFTAYNYYYVMSMRSQYSIRVYELLKSHENQYIDIGVEYTLEELRKIWMIDDDKYAKWFDFKRYVLDTAVKEINKLTDVFVSYNPIKTGRSVTAVQFFIQLKEGTQLKLSQQEIESRLNPGKKKQKDDKPY